MRYAFVLIALLLAGCAQSEIGRWAQMQSTYNGSVRAFTTAANTGLINLEQAEIIETVRSVASDRLNASLSCIRVTPGACDTQLGDAADALEQLSLFLGGA